MKNLANNGRVSHLTAKMAGILGIRAIGRASDDGVLDMKDKVRGEANTIATIYKNMLCEGYCGGRVRIHHVQNRAAAKKLFDTVKKDFRGADISTLEAGGLCSFYAERGGLLVGFET
jgi:fatty acid-binding protein DegV